LCSNKSKAHEYCDNRSIAEAIKHIPVINSILVTNDLRYPAEGYQRDNKQFQLSAIYGNQCLASSKYFITKETEAVFKEGLEIKRMLGQDKWNDSLNHFFSKYSITHVLIHKQYFHPSEMPLTRLFDNANFAVYKVE
jgi:predicted N-acyltransferase